MRGAEAAGHECGGDQLAVLDVNAKRDRRNAGAEPDVFVHRGRDDDAIRHDLGQLVAGEVTR